MKIKKQLQKTVSRLVDLSFKDNKISESQVVRSIKALKSLPRAEAIISLSEYLRSLKRKEREHTLYIETTMPLAQSQIKKVKGIVEKKVKITKVLVNINADILGGFKLRVGDEIWDESVAGKIQQIKEAIGR
ncbi:F0F1 ATP synthase subunit delta [Candidatus Daviesbacteria bacterium]|nr:F0F1 ATP synthase subunit delta [Candidatus Daviesbacteria bacterium]